MAEAALPLHALIHSFDRIRNPWILGGTISYGFPGGVEIAKNLQPKVWISAHDEDKDLKGVSSKAVKTIKFTTDEIRAMLKGQAEGASRAICPNTEVLCLGAGEDYRIESESRGKQKS